MHVSTPLQYWRLFRMALHLLAGLATVALAFGWLDDAARAKRRREWSRKLLAILGITLQCDADRLPEGCLIVSNHISWVDIFAINALLPAAFISKAEVRNWPAIGWLASRNDTVFLRRGSRGHARIVNAEIAAMMDSGKVVALFPEGTTTDGTHVQHFHAALLQPAINARRPIVPLAISYHNADGSRSLAAAYDGDVSLGQSMMSIAGANSLAVRLQFAPAIDTTEQPERRVVGLRAREAIVSLACPENHVDGAVTGSSVAAKTYSGFSAAGG